MEELKQYELRPLKSKDVFPMVRIISKFGVTEFKKCFDPAMISQMVGSASGNESKDQLAEKVGFSVVFDIADVILTNLPKCESEIFDFLASISNLKRKEIENLPMDVFFEMIVDFVKKDEFKDFFGAVTKLLK